MKIKSLKFSELVAQLINERDIIFRVVPTCIAIVPVSMLLGVLAAQTNWSVLEIFLFSLLGFTGSGQFALLPLADQGVGFFTMLMVAVSINSRYIPIAFSTAERLPRPLVQRMAIAYMLGDEAYALDREQANSVEIFITRFMIYGTWVASSVVGLLLAGLIPKQLLSISMNLGYPASIVLLVLSFNQLKTRIPQISSPWTRVCLEMLICVLVAVILLSLMGKVWFWLPSIAFSVWRLWEIHS